MASVKLNTTLQEYQSFVKDVYGLSNDRYFEISDMLINIQRFTMRGLKGIRKQDVEATKLNLMIAESWFMSLMNQLHIDLAEKVWKRFPYACSYCASCPCSCKKRKIKTRQPIIPNEKKHPKTFVDFQIMFKHIYPSESRTIEDAGIHLAEEIGELSEAFLKYQNSKNNNDFAKIVEEAADFFSCLMGVFNSLNISVPQELSKIFQLNCHECRKIPCQCSFDFIMNYKS